jgi:hypothetical protein
LARSRRRESIALSEMRHCPSIFSAPSRLSQSSAYTCLRLTPSRRAASRTLTASLAFNFIPPKKELSCSVVVLLLECNCEIISRQYFEALWHCRRVWYFECLPQGQYSLRKVEQAPEGLDAAFCLPLHRRGIAELHRSSKCSGDSRDSRSVHQKVRSTYFAVLPRQRVRFHALAMARQAGGVGCGLALGLICADAIRRCASPSVRGERRIF